MSGRGGRGGGRGGRGGGRGGFQGDRPRGGPEGVAVGTLTHADLQRTVKTERLYPVSPTSQHVDNQHGLFKQGVA
jgi:hypothetical protein